MSNNVVHFTGNATAFVGHRKLREPVRIAFKQFGALTHTKLFDNLPAPQQPERERRRECEGNRDVGDE